MGKAGGAIVIIGLVLIFLIVLFQFTVIILKHQGVIEDTSADDKLLDEISQIRESLSRIENLLSQKLDKNDGGDGGGGEKKL